MSYDVFISYRRKGPGAGVAGEMQSKLESRGYKVFLDVDSIGSGAFPDQIDHAIQQCNDFLLILSPGMLDRCSDEEDWVRHEIVLAEKYGKNIVGVSLPGFVMPSVESLPAELHEIPEKQVFLWSHEYRQASFEKILDNLKSTTLKKKRNKRNFSGIGLVAALIVGVVWFLLSSDASSEVQEEMPTPSAPNNINYKQIITQAVNDTFASYLREGDSLLQLVPDNPSDKQDFVLFMEGIEDYRAALDYEKEYPNMISNVSSVRNSCDSLMNLRKTRFKHELEAATKFIEIDQIEFAQFRYENAEVLALPEESKLLEAVGKKLHN